MLKFYISTMKSFVVSALKYRPTNFNDVVGQSTVTKTLENAIKLNQIPQAMLFCGPRGVGKTTCARVLAKKINSNIDKTNSFSYNIFELDAASNNGVDDIRSLIEQVRVPPQIGNFKVYIIDEVHMLSGAAFNAFLKTLEEPPSYAIFILATTEKHKVIPTILSRCQIFDFKKIGFVDIKNFLIDISIKEKLNYDNEALSLIAKKSDGSLRDALSIFDRLVNYTEGNITKELTYENLNEVSYETYFKMADIIKNGDIPEALVLLDQVIKNGNNEHNFIHGFSCHLRDLLVAKNIKSKNLLDLDDDLENYYENQSKNFKLNILVSAIEICDDCINKFRNTKNQRLLLEISLMKLCSLFEQKKKNLTNEENFIIEKVENKTESKNPENNTTISKKNNKIDQNFNTRIVSGLSISSVKEKKRIENENLLNSKIEEQKINKEEVNQKELLKFWNKFSEDLNKKGKKNFSSILQLSKPKLKNKNEIHYTLSNNINKIELEKNKNELMSFLSKNLRNDFLELILIVNKNEEKKFIYSAKEKFERMKKINPSIDKMRKDFKLGL